MLWILEGPDGAGKTTLANKLGGAYLHHDQHSTAKHFAGSMQLALQGYTVVLDRCWISEPIYAAVFRKAPSRVSPIHRRMLDRMALAAGAKAILCLPPFEVCAQTFSSGREEMLKDTTQLKAVYDRYELPLDTDIPIIKYDYTADSFEELTRRVDLAPQHDIKVTLVCESSHMETAYTVGVPYVSFGFNNAADWLAEQLEMAEIPESALKWLNAYDGFGNEASPKSIVPGSKVITLGKKAEAWCKEHDIKYESAPAPIVHKRHYFGEPYRLLALLERAL